MLLAKRILPWAVLILVLATLGAVLPTYWIYLFSTVAVSAIVARSIGLVTNQAGMITLSQMSFAAIGGWVVSWASLELPGAPFPLLVLLGGLVTTPIGLLLGLATLRIRGIELAVVTLGFAAALDLILGRMSFPGAGQGIPVIPSSPFSTPIAFYALAWAALILLHLLVRSVGRSRLGLSWTAVRISERATAALGIRVGLAKTTAFGLGAALAGVAGGLLAGQFGLLNAEVFSPITSMVYFATALIAGASLLSGAVLAGVLSVFVPELLRRIGLPLDIGNAIFALGAFDVLRRGHGGIAEQAQRKLMERRFRDARTDVVLSPLEPPTAVAPATLDRDGVLLEVDRLSVSFGANRVLDDVELTVRDGEVHALIGPNGAGKSTFVDAVTGFLPGYGGEVRLLGENLAGRSARERSRAGLRRTFQQSRVIDGVTVAGYLRLAGQAQGDAALTEEIGEFLGLPNGEIPIALMDIGSRRVLEIAGALASRPRLILLDEPASGLSEEESLALAQRVGEMPKRFGCSVLLIEHDMSFVRTASDRITVLDYGEQICSGGVDEVLSDPRVIAAYLGKEISA
ncbi:MAG: ABC transporter permease subunit [Leucobacter sp.]